MCGDSLCLEKLEEIQQFRSEQNEYNLTTQQIEKLISIYNKYRYVFSDVPGKVKDYQFTLQFKEPVNFNKKSYPVAYALKEAVRAELDKMIAEDIIEYSCSPYTSPLIACLLYTSRCV